MDLHMLGDDRPVDVGRLRTRRARADRACTRRWSCATAQPHFQHIFSGDGYAAGYYSYLWSEVLDADAFDAFEEAGDIFDPATAKRLRDHIYAAGYRRDPAEAYRAFRGPRPRPEGALAQTRTRRPWEGGRLARRLTNGTSER